MTTRSPAILAAALLGMLAFGPPAAAVVYTVTSTADGAGVCPHSTSCTLRTAITNANALPGTDALILLPGVYNVGNQHLISDDLAIYGQPGVVLDGGMGQRVFEISPGADVLMSKLEIKRGHASSGTLDGGAIYNRGDLQIYDSDLHHNGAVDDGGAIYTSGPLTLVRTELDQNIAEDMYGTSYGGGIYCYNTTVTIRDASAVIANIANSGGGIYASRCYVTVEESQVSYNVGINVGGGIGTATSEVTVTDGSEINENYANYGGGLYLNNVAACPLASCETIVTASAVDGNQVSTDGAGIRIRGDTLVMTLGSTLRDNIADGLGGGIKADDAELQLQLGTDLSDNQADSGGAVWADGGVAVLSGVTVHDNEGTTLAAGSGGAIYVRDGEFDVVDSYFWFNEGYDGGSAYLKDLVARPNFSRVMFIQDDAAHRGGSLYFSGVDSTNAPIFEYGQILYSTSLGDGGGIALEGDPADPGWSPATRPLIQRSALDSNAAYTLGGGLFTTVDVRLRNTTFSRNTADYGGAVYVSNAAGSPDVYADNVTIAMNTALYLGGGLNNHGVFHTANTVLANNGSGGSYDCYSPAAGSMLSQNYNWIEDFTNCNMALLGADQVWLDPMLGALNAAPSYHFPLPAGSPLVDTGGCVATDGGAVGPDQLDVKRPANGLCDRGAIERP